MVTSSYKPACKYAVDTKSSRPTPCVKLDYFSKISVTVLLYEFRRNDKREDETKNCLMSKIQSFFLKNLKIEKVCSTDR